jgi:SAM-dependent methyltransferase
MLAPMDLAGQITAYLRLALDRKARHDVETFVREAYRLALQRPPDESGLAHWTGAMRDSRVSRWALLRTFFRAKERFWVKHKCTQSDVLHPLRCDLVKMLPPAERVVDLGGASVEGMEGALLRMGYPHRPREITIVDLPPDERMYAECFPHIRDEAADWILCGPTRVRYLHQSMADLTGVPDGSIDLVWSGESIEHVTPEDGRKVFREAWRVLRPGGYLCLDTPNRVLTGTQAPNGFIHPEHKIEYTVPQLTAELTRAGFQIVEASGIVPMPKSAREQDFDPREMIANARLSPDAEVCYLFYVKCVKPVGN